MMLKIVILGIALAAIVFSGTMFVANIKTDDQSFVTTWQTASPNEPITIPVGNATGAYTVDWGDGSMSANVTGDQSHAYRNAGTYTVAITDGFERIYLNGDLDNAAKLKSIEQWGDVAWTSMGSAFNGASNMIYNAADVPDLSGVTDMSCMFADAIRFDGDISSWNVSNVRDMSCMFATLHPFNYVTLDNRICNDTLNDFNTADTFNDRTLDCVESRAWSTIFNGDISGWDVSGVRDMSRMFYHAGSFNGNLSGWDVSGVRDMSRMFYHAGSFNGNLSGWDVSGVRDMSRMFYWAKSFNGDLSGWDVSGVRDMSGMFIYAGSFNGDLSGWDVSGVRDMSHMFYAAYSFNGDLSGWDVSGVRDMSRMFHRAGSFNQNLGNWYIILDNTSIDIGDGTEVIGNIAAQNSLLDSQDITYEIGTGGDSALFAINGDAMKIKPSADYGKTEYAINVTSTGDFGVNNFQMIDVMVTRAGDAGPP